MTANSRFVAGFALGLLAVFATLGAASSLPALGLDPVMSHWGAWALGASLVYARHVGKAMDRCWDAIESRGGGPG